MKMKIFKDINGLELIIKSRKSAVIFETRQDQLNNKYVVYYKFTDNNFNDLLVYLETISNESWNNLTPKVADSFGSDYFEYYDKELDNNGYLTIRKNEIKIDRPFLESNKLYKFNKSKMQSFIYDFRKLIV